jgi:hypothetical protein
MRGRSVEENDEELRETSCIGHGISAAGAVC